MKNATKIFVIVIAAIAAARILIPPQPMFLLQGQPSNVIFDSAKKVTHWLNNAPAHASVFAAVPINIVIEFDAAPVSGSVTITHGEKDYGEGSAAVEEARLIRQVMDPAAPDGKYNVLYRICLQSGQCENGSFQFAIESRLSSDFEDHRGRPDIPPDIAISIENSSFVPKKIRIRKNTRVIWTNNDSVDHTVNAGNYFPKQNSASLKPKEAFEIVFSEVGEYPYYDRLYPETMTGSLLVED